MPILWRYALHSYLRIFLLSISTFIAVLLIARFKEIARFTAMTGDFEKTGLFIVYQIPSILPIAIPLSALITSLLLFQRLSRTYELTALRASGLSLITLLTPLLLTSFLLSLFNFSICADLAPYCRREAKMLYFKETSENPLVLLQRQKLIKIKNAYLEMKVLDDETTENLLIIAHNSNTNRLGLLSAKKLQLSGNDLLGSQIHLVSYLPSTGYDTLLLERQAEMSISAPLLSNALKRHRPRLDVNALGFRMLRLSKKETSANIEMLRRISLSLAVFSFTFLGCAFGIEQGRNPKKTNLFKALLLTLTVLLSYLLAKELKNNIFLSIAAFLLPHPFIWLMSSLHLQRIAKGRA